MRWKAAHDKWVAQDNIIKNNIAHVRYYYFVDYRYSIFLCLDLAVHPPILSSMHLLLVLLKVKLKVRWIYIAPSRETSKVSNSGMDHTVLPANYTMPAFTL